MAFSPSRSSLQASPVMCPLLPILSVIPFFFYREVGKKSRRFSCVLIWNLSSVSEAFVDVSPVQREGRVSHSCAELFLVGQSSSLNIFWVV